MRKTKIIAAVLSLTMLAGLFTGCSSKTTKITTDKFIKACEKLDLKDYAFGGKKTPVLDDLDKGFYIYADTDMVEDEEESLDDFLKEINLDDVFEAGNIKSFAFAAKCDGFDYDDIVFDADDLSDIELDGAAAFQMTLDGNYAADFMAYLEDLLDKTGISTDDLSDKEYFASKNEGYLRLHVDLEDLIEDINGSDYYHGLYNYLYFSTEGLIDTLDDVTGEAAISVEVNGNCIFVIFGFNTNTKDAEVISDFVKAFGASCDPMTVPVNEDVAQDLVNKYLGSIADEIVPYPGDPVPTPTQPVNNGAAKVGISMPTQDLMRWKQDGENLKYEIEFYGYQADLQFAGNDVSTQVMQIEDMINSGCEVLIIAAIDVNSLNTVLEKATAAGVTVIAYDRLIMGTSDVDYYVTFDNYMAGQLQAEYIVESLGLNSGAGPFNIEITAGEPGDDNAAIFFNGAMDTLLPYIASGQLNVISGQIDFFDCATDLWSTENARGRAESIIGNYYLNGTEIDAWLCSNDSTALGVIQALEASGYNGNWPIITGQDCDIISVKNIIAGKQTMSVFKDTRILVWQAASMADDILSGGQPPVNNTNTFYNASIIVPTYLCAPEVVDINNYETILIGGGYYTVEDLT